ncbi:MAG: carboxylesterase [Gammaproteobacteria bacterium]|nr:MAG: carboxylesterase [Gammaproteobacteria bacterium]
MSKLNYIEIEPSAYGNPKPAEFAVIWLHGLGASGHDFEPIVPELRLPKELAIRFIFPHAPNIPVTINGGLVMPAWYDILNLNPQRNINEEQFQTSTAEATALINREIKREIASKHIVLAGFSQGGAIAYHTALAYPAPLAGLLCLSTYFPAHPELTPHDANQETPIFVSHGQMDPMVPETMGKEAFRTLQNMGYKVRYQSYPMAHEVCAQQISDISIWLQELLLI